MDVFVIPVASDRYELYCESSVEADGAGEEDEAESPPEGWLGRMGHRFSPGRVWRRFRRRFSLMLKAAEQRQHRHDHIPEPRGWAGRLNDTVMGWVVERIAEQRLLWNLRREEVAEAVHPEDMTFEQVMTLIRRKLQRDYERHRLWLIIDAVGLIVSGALAVLPGPNLIAYYFLFRVWGHWLSMRGARQGLDRATWTGRPCPSLTELRDVVVLDAPTRAERVHDIAARLRLQHLASFFERSAIRHA